MRSPRANDFMDAICLGLAPRLARVRLSISISRAQLFDLICIRSVISITSLTPFSCTIATKMATKLVKNNNCLAKVGTSNYRRTAASARSIHKPTLALRIPGMPMVYSGHFSNDLKVLKLCMWGFCPAQQPSCSQGLVYSSVV